MNLPNWLKVKKIDRRRYLATYNLINRYRINTVCLEANCPNRYECFAHSTATFMILGGICTRNCRYCNIKKGKPEPVDQQEPKRVALAVKRMELDYAVVTCVTRDDLPDGGADQFIKTIKAIKKDNPGCKVEILISDLKGNWLALKKILAAGPDLVNHNIEAAKDIFVAVRPKGNYELSLNLLGKIKEIAAGMKTKSGFMVGLGENKKQIAETFEDLKKNSCQIVTVGQYLQPSPKHYQVKKYYKPSEFREIELLGKRIGIERVIAGPLIRSSYKAMSAFERHAILEIT